MMPPVATTGQPASYSRGFDASKLQIAADYWRMGNNHILEGVDHLLFVLALMLIVSGFRSLLKAVTAFTVADSITLALATLGLVHMPAAPTEAIISLSIVFLAAEIVHKRNGQVGLTERYPWLIAFSFGLFHGLGFAGALSEIGVPQHEVPLALLMFNIGVETGQLLFIATVLSLMVVLKRVPLTAPQRAWRVLQVQHRRCGGILDDRTGTIVSANGAMKFGWPDSGATNQHRCRERSSGKPQS